MVQTNAQRQKRYRQGQAIERLRNDYSVTLLLRECARADIDIWPVLIECTEAIFEKDGDGLQFIRNVTPLLFSLVFARNLIKTQAVQAGRLA